MQKILLVLVAIVLGSSVSTTTAEVKYNNNTVKSKATNNDKLFLKEYTYNASEDDSKNSSRKKAIAQIKIILSEEVGTHISSSLDIKQTTKNGVSQKHVKQEINSLSASITNLKIIDEQWNGVTYYIKASVRINEENTMALLLEAIKAKASEKDVKRLNKILAEQNKSLDKSYDKIQTLNKTLIAQEISNQASQHELKETKLLLNNLLKEKQTYERKIVEQKAQINKIKKLVAKAKSRIKSDNKKACLMTKGMTKYEITKAIGRPSGHNSSYPGDCTGNYSSSINDSSCIQWFYGTVTLQFETNGLLRKKSGC